MKTVTSSFVLVAHHHNLGRRAFGDAAGGSSGGGGGPGSALAIAIGKNGIPSLIVSACSSIEKVSGSGMTLGNETTTVIGGRMKRYKENPAMMMTTESCGQCWKSFPSTRRSDHYECQHQNNVDWSQCLSTRQINTRKHRVIDNSILTNIITKPSEIRTIRNRRRYMSTASPANMISTTDAVSVDADVDATTSSHEEGIIAATRRWLENIVVGHKLCPFAVPLVKHPNTHKIRIVHCPHSIPSTTDTAKIATDDDDGSSNDSKNCLQFVRREVEYLMELPTMDRDSDTDCEKQEAGEGNFIEPNTSNSPVNKLHHETTLIVFDYDYGSDPDNKNHEEDFSFSSTVDNVDGSKETAASRGTVLDSKNNSKYLDFVRFSWELQEYAILGQDTQRTMPMTPKLGSIDHSLDHENENGDRCTMKSYQDDVQIVLFHPNATHQTYGQNVSDDAGDYTIRSPYPTIHLLREQDVLSAVKSGYPGLEYLPSRNQAKMKSLGSSACRKQLKACIK